MISGLSLAGCADDSVGARPLPDGKSLTVASQAPGMEYADALAAYRAMWHDLTVASRTSDASSPLLDDHARGGALELLKYGLRKSEKEGLVSKGAPKVNPEVVTAGADKVVLTDCVDDTGWLLYKSNGKPSFFQMKNVRDARRQGIPLAVIQHEDVLIFTKAVSPTRVCDRALTLSRPRCASRTTRTHATEGVCRPCTHRTQAGCGRR
ncbi:hypothetical protein ACFXMT_18855 [Streptomyces mirabilis]|uniref:hypothetical protein n=1 Tax=Streptomyces mirabilis TaxID=68239 RepID=UPI0036A0D5F1